MTNKFNENLIITRKSFKHLLAFAHKMFRKIYKIDSTLMPEAERNR
jgi:hypothetical protein